MGSSPSKTNDSTGPDEVNNRPTRMSQVRCKSPLQRPSSSLSISSRASFSPFSVLPPVTSRDEATVGRPASGSKRRKTSRHTQIHEEGSVYLPDTRIPLPDIRNSIMSKAGSSDRMKTTLHRSNNHGRPSLQPLDSLHLMRENGLRRHRRNRNGEDLTQSGYNKSDLEIAVQASLAISETQDEELMANEDEKEQEKSDDENEEEGMENCDTDIRNGDLTESGYDKRDLDVAVQMSLAISEELNQDLMESGYDKRDLDVAVQMSLAISEELQWQQQGDEGVEEEDSGERHDDKCKFTKSGYDEEELKRAIETSLATSSEGKGRNWMRSGYDPMKTEYISIETDIGVNQSNDDPADKNRLDEENGSGESSKSDKEEEERSINNEEQERDPSDFLDEELLANEDEEEQEKSDDENEEEGMENCDPYISCSIDEILSDMRNNVCYSEYTTLNIKRSCVWESALEQFSQEYFSPMREFNVNFVDDEGNAEGAIDAGGPRREYFQLMMDHLANCSLFEGPSGRKLLSYDVQANRRNEYFYAGMVIGQSLLYGGPVPHFLSPLLLECLILEPENVTGSRGDIYDPDWLQLLDEVRTTDCVRDFVLNHNKTLHIAGCLRNEKMENRHQLIQDLINYYLVERTRPAFEK